MAMEPQEESHFSRRIFIREAATQTDPIDKNVQRLRHKIERKKAKNYKKACVCATLTVAGIYIAKVYGGMMDQIKGLEQENYGLKSDLSIVTFSNLKLKEEADSYAKKTKDINKPNALKEKKEIICACSRQHSIVYSLEAGCKCLRMTNTWGDEYMLGRLDPENLNDNEVRKFKVFSDSDIAILKKYPCYKTQLKTSNPYECVHAFSESATGLCLYKPYMSNDFEIHSGYCSIYKSN